MPPCRPLPLVYLHGLRGVGEACLLCTFLHAVPIVLQLEQVASLGHCSSKGRDWKSGVVSGCVHRASSGQRWLHRPPAPGRLRLDAARRSGECGTRSIAEYGFVMSSGTCKPSGRAPPRVLASCQEQRREAQQAQGPCQSHVYVINRA